MTAIDLDEALDLPASEPSKPRRDLALVRHRLRETRCPKVYSGPLHVAAVTAAALGVIGYSISRVEAPAWWELAIAPLAFFAANLVEYFAHRGPMHHRTRGVALLFERHTLEHHFFFPHDAMQIDRGGDLFMVLFPPYVIAFFSLAFAAPVTTLLCYLVSNNAGFVFLGTALSYFLLYEWLHMAYHLPESSWLGGSRLIRALRRHHTRHHDLTRMTEANFNVTFPIADALFGTIEK